MYCTHTSYTNACNNPNHIPVLPWDNPNNPRPLNIPITTEETSTAMLQIKTGKAQGTNKLPGKFLKYSQEVTAPLICNMLNSMFINHQPIPEINTGRMVILNKPLKTPTSANIRPLTVLNDIRNLYSNIVKNRTEDKLFN